MTKDGNFSGDANVRMNIFFRAILSGDNTNFTIIISFTDSTIMLKCYH